MTRTKLHSRTATLCACRRSCRHVSSCRSSNGYILGFQAITSSIQALNTYHFNPIPHQFPASRSSPSWHTLNGSSSTLSTVSEMDPSASRMRKLCVSSSHLRFRVILASSYGTSDRSIADAHFKGVNSTRTAIKTQRLALAK